MEWDGVQLTIEEAEALRASFVLPEDAAAAHAATMKALAAHEPALTTRIRQRDAQGRLRHLQLYQRFFYDAEGRPLHSISATRDITEEVEVAERLRQQA